MGVIGDLNKYMKFQAAESLTAEGEAGGAAATGAGMGMGLAMAQQMAAAFSPAGAASPAAAAAPPPLPSEPSYYIAVNGAQTGPFQGHALHDEIAAGRLHREALVWSAGMAAWTKASDIPAIARLFDVAPPPIPEAPPSL